MTCRSRLVAGTIRERRSIMAESVNSGKGRITRAAGALMVVAGLAIAAWFAAPYIAELFASDYSGYVLDDQLDDGGFPVIDWDGLLAVNSDVIGWVRIEGTLIDYPVVQASPDDPQFYLTHGLDGSWNGHGVPYIDCDCPGVSAQNIIVYGHNMIDGSMFAAIASYTQQDFLDSHRQVLFMTPQHNFRLEAVCASEVSAWESHPRISFNSTDEISSYLAEQASVSAAAGRVPSSAGRIFELVCCSYGTSNGRTTLFCVEPEDALTSYEGGYYGG